MGSLARLALGACLGLAACEGEPGAVATPEFADALPGRTAVALWGSSQPPDDLREWIQHLAVPLALQSVEAPGVVAYRASDQVEVGWASLADSQSFHRALKHLDEPAEYVLYVDLQLLIESASLVWPEDLQAVRERAMRALVLRGFDSAILALNRRGDGWTAAGVVGTSGSPSGIPGLLTSAVDGEAVAPVPDRQSRLQVEAFYDDAVAQRLFEALTRTGDRSSMFGSLYSGPARILDEFVDQIRGRISVSLHGLAGLRASARVRDPELVVDRARELIDQFGSRITPRLEQSDDWVTLRLPGSPAWKPSGSAERISGPFLWSSLQLPEQVDLDERRLTVLLQRHTGDLIHIRLTLE